MAKKIKATVIETRDALEARMGDYARLVLEFERLTVEMEQRLANVRGEYEARLAALADAGDAALEDLHAWAALHPEEFEKRRSVELLHGQIGFRTGTPAIRQASGVKAEHSVALLDAARPEWIRTSKAIDKERILADMSGKPSGEVAGILSPYGLRLDRSETFWAEIKREKED